MTYAPYRPTRPGRGESFEALSLDDLLREAADAIIGCPINPLNQIAIAEELWKRAGWFCLLKRTARTPPQDPQLLQILQQLDGEADRG